MAATVVASFAIAGPASASTTPNLIKLTPGAASQDTGVNQTYTATITDDLGNPVDPGTVVDVQVRQAATGTIKKDDVGSPMVNPSTYPLGLASDTGASWAGQDHGITQDGKTYVTTDVATVTSTNGVFTFKVDSKVAGDVTVNVFKPTGAGDLTLNDTSTHNTGSPTNPPCGGPAPQPACTYKQAVDTYTVDDGTSSAVVVGSSATLTVGGGATDASKVTQIKVDPSSIHHYKNADGTTVTFTATPEDKDGHGVANVTVSWLVKGADNINYPVTSANACGAPTSLGNYDVTCTFTSNSTESPAVDLATFWVNGSNGTTSATPGPDSGEAQTVVNATFDDEPLSNATPPAPIKVSKSTISTGAHVDPNTGEYVIQTGVASTVPVSVHVVDNDGVAVKGVSIRFNLSGSIYGGNNPDPMSAVTDASGSATVNVPVTALQAVGGKELRVNAWISEQLDDNTAPFLGYHITNGGPIRVHVVEPQLSIELAPGYTEPIQAAKGGTVSVPVVVTDQFGNTGGAGDNLKYVVTGRNSVTDTAVVGASGAVTITYPDQGTAGDFDNITITDITHPSVVAFSGNNLIQFLTDVTPAKIAWDLNPDPNQVVPVDSDWASGVAPAGFGVGVLHVTNAAGEGLTNQQVKISTDIGRVAGLDPTMGFTSPTFDKATSTTTAPSLALPLGSFAEGASVFFYGSEKSGVQHITATDGSLSVQMPNPVQYFALQPYNITLTPDNATVAPGAKQKFTAKVTDEYGNPSNTFLKVVGGVVTPTGSQVIFTQSGAGSLLGGVSTTQGAVNTDGTVSVTLDAGTTSNGTGTITAIPQPQAGQADDTQTPPVNIAEVHYTIGAVSVSRVKVDGIKGVGIGGSERVAVRVWRADGSFAANVPVTFKVKGANTANGRITTDSNGFGNFFYTPTATGTDTVTATAGGKSGSTTVKIVRPHEVPVLQAISRSTGTVNIAVQTHPAVKARKVKIYYVFDPGPGQRKVLKYAGYGMTNNNGRAHTVLKFKSGSTVVLKARMAGSDYVEHLSNRFPVHIK